MLKNMCLLVRSFEAFQNAISLIIEDGSFHVQFSVLFIRDLFISEPKGSTEELEPVLKGYYDAILGKAPVKRGRGGSKQIVKNRVTKNTLQESTKAGAALLAVCRGKVLLYY